MAIEVVITLKKGQSVPNVDPMQYGQDIEVFDRHDLADARVAELTALGVKAKKRVKGDHA